LETPNSKKLRQTRNSNLWLQFQTLILLPAVGLLLRVLGFWRSYKFLKRISQFHLRRSGKFDQPLSEAIRIGNIVGSTNKKISLYLATCLPESLTLWYILRRKGLDANLCLGARTVTGEFEAHAWVEFDQVVLNDDQDINIRYEPFDIDSADKKK